MSNVALDTVTNNSDDNSCISDINENRITSQDKRAGDLSALHQNSSSPQPFQDLTTSVEANVSNFNEAQFGTRFVAENMTVVIGGSQEKCTDNSVFPQVFLKKNSKETNSVRNKCRRRRKDNKNWIYSGLYFMCILLLVIVCFLATKTLESMAEKVHRWSKDNKTHKNVFSTENRSKTTLNLVPYGFAMPPNKSFNASLVREKLNFPLITGPYLSSESTPNETILVLSRMPQSFDIVSIFKVKSFQPKLVNASKINAIFETARCASFPNCLSKIHNYPDLGYNFILFQGVLVEGSGWIRNSDDDSLSIMFLFRHDSIIKDRLMYIFLVLVNVSISCGYVNKDFTLKIHNNKFYKEAKGYDKFMSIIEALKGGMYYIDDLDIFKLETVKLSNKIRRVCPLFKICNNTCIGQSCLKSVCKEEKCFVQCIQ